MDDPDITEELAKVKLDSKPYRWIDAFQEELGIRSAAALRLVGGESYPIIVRYAKHAWEKKALRKLFGIYDDDSEPSFTNQFENSKEKLKQRYSEADQQFNELKRLNSEGKNRSDETVKVHETALRERLLVPLNIWIPENETLEKLINAVQHILQQIDQLLQQGGDNDGSKLLENISDGRALQGIMLSKNIEEQIQPRDQLIKVPENAEILVASHPKIDATEEFSSQEKENEFMQIVDTLGYSAITPSKQGGLWSICEESGVQIVANTTASQQQDRKTKLYLSTVRYTTIPIASFIFENSDLLLSDAALNDLKKIEGAIQTYGSESPQTKEECSNFLKRFGSHVSRGPLHFGGAFWQKCSSEGFKLSERVTLKLIQENAVKMQICVCHSYSAPYSSEQGANSSSGSSLTTKYSDKCSDIAIAQTQLKCRKIPEENSEAHFSVWKSALSCNNHKWCLIDRGTTLVPVWKIVEMNHGEMFEESVTLVDVLKKNWEDLNEISHSGMNAAAEILKETEDSWKSKEELEDEPTEKKSQIQELIEVKEWVIKQKMNPQAWSLWFLSQDSLQQFIRSVVDQQTSSPLTTDSDFTMIKLLMQQLITRTDLNAAHSMDFELKTQLCQWLYDTQIEKHFVLPMLHDDFLDFETYLQQAVQCLENEKKSTTKLQYCTSVLTAAVSRAINSFREGLQHSGQKYEDLFFTTLFFPFKISTSYNPLVINLLSEEDLQYLCDLIKEKSHVFFILLRSKNVIKIQAFLFQVAVDIYISGKQDITAHHILNHLLYLKGEIGDHLESQVSKILFKNLPSMNIINFLSQYLQTSFVSDFLSSYIIPNAQTKLMCQWQQLEIELNAIVKFSQFESGSSIEDVLQKGSKAISNIHAEKSESEQLLSKDFKNQDTCTVTSGIELSEYDNGDEEYYSCEDDENFSADITLNNRDSSELQKNEYESPSQAVIKLFDTLDLLKYHPQKLTLNEALSIKKETLGVAKCLDPKKLYIFLLQKIMAYDCRCRENQLHMPKSTITTTTEKSQNLDSDSDDDNDEFDSDDDSKIHPMDSLLAVLHCADDFLRQDLMARLVDCKLSIPLILPNFFNGKLTLPLWSMRAIVKEWKSTIMGKQEFHECPLVSYPAAIVSFVRFGRQEKSKSKMINNVLSSSNHGHFFHRDCEGGSSKWLLGAGLVEMSWYLPAGKENDIFPDLVTFLNLRGNALDHPQQIAFLSNISCMIFAFITEEDLNEESAKVLKQFSETPGGVVICTTSQRSKFKHLTKDIPKVDCVTLKKKNEDETKKALQAVIKKRLEEVWNATGNFTQKLEDCMQIAVHCKIFVDEHRQELVKSMESAQILMKLLENHSNPDHSAKESMLPLQGKDMWQEWAAEDKEEHRRIYRGDMGIEEYGIQKSKKKKSIRRDQLQYTRHLSPLMEKFIMTLLNTTGTSRKYFLQCLKLYLNNLSRNTIASWQREHKEERIRLLSLQRKKKEQGNEALVLKCKKNIEKLHKQIINASLGLEHLFRELGQVYEAVQDSAPLSRNMYNRLPMVAAELLIDGYPLELMDGDAAHVPLEWVTAVIQEVTKLANNPRVYVLSVLGLQSTGKSTLINTTFGLQFNVGAGRCTRGAFMQLLPISEGLRKEIKCDYILVVDTEGLRAPELDSQKMQKHDNELATFVIGIANETMINIYGEVPGDMDDILQTAVHAFIRMKSVKFNPSCQFIHQNVGAVAARDKSGMGRSKFKDKLDMMTSEAAKEEKREREFEYFSDVIHFEEEKDVHHFPGLWNGIPPMAHVNPEYSDKALSLKSHLVERIRLSKGLQKLSSVELHIGDLWNALLHEKFVFSFKNTLEIAVYNSLEAKYSQWSWSFRSEMLEWERNAGNEIKNSQGPDEVKQLKYRLTNNELPRKVNGIYERLQKEMNSFFEESEQREMMNQWYVQTKQRLERLKNKLQDHAQGFCHELINSQEAQQGGRQMKIRYKDEVIRKVKLLISEQSKDILKMGKDSEETVESKLREIFDAQWEDWMDDIARQFNAQRYSEGKDIELGVQTQVQDSLLEYHKSIEHLITARLYGRPISQWGKRLHLYLEERHVLLNYNWFVRTGKQIKHYIVGKSTPKPVLTNEAHKKLLSSITIYAFERVEVYLESRKKENYNPSFTHELLVILNAAIIERAEAQSELILTDEYYVDMALTACGYAIRKFCVMVEAFREQNDPIVNLTKEMKNPLFRLFKNTFLQSADEKIAACTLCDLLANSIEKEVFKSLPEVIFKDMASSPWAVNKVALKAKILLDLGEDLQKSGLLNNYFLHLKAEHFKDSLQKWLGKYTKEHCEKKHKESTRLVFLAKRKATQLVEDIKQHSREATNKTVTEKLKKAGESGEQVEKKAGESGEQVEKKAGESGEQVEKKTEESGTEVFPVEEWLIFFLSENLTKQLDVNDLRRFHTFCDIKELKDIENFEQELTNGLDAVEEKLHKEFGQLTIEGLNEQEENKPDEHLYKQLCGCTVQCPFCGEQCDNTDDEHTTSHHVVQHRPQCLGGYRNLWTRELVPDVCNSLIADGEQSFINKDTNGKFIPYSKYEETYPNWQIPPDMSAKSAFYWKWFLGHYSQQVATEFGARDNKVLHEWNTITWEEAKTELKKMYKI